jgi:hypothetical protein
MDWYYLTFLATAPSDLPLAAAVMPGGVRFLVLAIPRQRLKVNQASSFSIDWHYSGFINCMCVHQIGFISLLTCDLPSAAVRAKAKCIVLCRWFNRPLRLAQKFSHVLVTVACYCGSEFVNFFPLWTAFTLFF